MGTYLEVAHKWQAKAKIPFCQSNECDIGARVLEAHVAAVLPLFFAFL